MNDFLHLTTVSLPASDGYCLVRPRTGTPYNVDTPNINTLALVVAADDGTSDVSDYITPYGSLDDTNYYAVTASDGSTYVDGYNGPKVFDITKYSTIRLYASNLDVTASSVYVLGYEFDIIPRDIIVDDILNFVNTSSQSPALKAVGRDLWARTGDDGDFTSMAVKELDAYGNISLLDGYGVRHSLLPSCAVMYMVTPTATSLTANVWAKSAGITSSGLSTTDWEIGSANRITYIGSENPYVNIQISVSAFTNTATTQMFYAIAQNGNICECSIMQRYHATATDVGSIDIQTLRQLSNGDYIELYIKADDSIDTTVKYMNVSVNTI